MNLIDTHSHIHDDEFFGGQDKDSLFAEAVEAGVTKVICVGVDAKSSRQAVDYSKNKDGCFASVALHPHDADHSEKEMNTIRSLAAKADKSKVVAVGECGLDYYYANSVVVSQRQVLIDHFEIAKANNLPMIFHIRGSAANPDDAFSDFWEIYDKYKIPGVVHSFSAYRHQLNDILKRGLYVGINGIITFSRDENQLDAMLGVPMEKLVLETDSPFLTPKPFRGKVNTSKNTNLVAEFIATKNKISIEELANVTTSNAEALFNI